MEFQEVIQKRYSCRKFTSEQITDQQLQAILEAGRLAPTAKNLQEQHVYVIQSEEYLAKVDSVTPCRYSAPTVLIVTYDKNNVYTYPGGGKDSGVEDAVIVSTHMILAAANEGVNSCWINNFDPEKLHDVLNLPENEEIVMMMDLGFADQYEPTLNHTNRNDIASFTTKL